MDKSYKVIALTSPGTGEGKSTICANLGVVLAQAGKKTLVLDCDLRKPTIHKVFGTRNIWGIANIGGKHSLQEIAQEPIPGLKLVAAGPPPPNPAEILGSKHFTRLVEQARQDFDFVLLDTPPVGLVSDVAIISAQADGVLLVLDIQRTRKRALRSSVKNLELVGSRIIGTVANNIKVSKNAYVGYGGHTYLER